MANDNSNLTLEIYKGYALQELDRWDAVIHPNVKANSPAGRDVVGLENLKRFNKAFHTAFRPRTDLIDHYVVGDRGLVMINLHWTHDGGPFHGIAPTGQSGTSVESFLLRLENGLVTHWDVADNSLDLANYLHDQGMELPRFVTPPALISG
jgi:predicted ester cyclase